METKEIQIINKQFAQAAVAFQHASKVLSEQMFNIERDAKELCRSLSNLPHIFPEKKIGMTNWNDPPYTVVEFVGKDMHIASTCGTIGKTRTLITENPVVVDVETWQNK